ncbi:hypothetical protein BDV95DRAFT_601811 [Massariosphaeria phaeospora]|uniref:Uncharacterized protein n=1 Tax=Massariosphaeria phaeospora TaxID=100035 RepID=A0A7C8IIQ6_9PLEO|nr:hypothetical protein BDV95DRAFT_601811 [Massariosphaeria phaeospora]
MPFLGHPLADEPLFDPPRSCIDAIYIGDFADKEDLNMYYPKEERYQPPAGLKLDNEDGDAIPLRQSVTEVYAHVGRNMEELKKVKGESIITFRALRRSLVELKQDYGVLQAALLVFIFPDAGYVLERIEQHLLKPHEDEVTAIEEATALKKSMNDDCNMLAVAAAIVAQVAITALSLENLSSAHWTAKAAFVLSLATGALSVFFACLLQQRISSLFGLSDLKDWLSKPAGSQDLREAHVQVQGLKNTGRKKRYDPTAISEEGPELWAELQRDFVTQLVNKRRWVHASFNAALMIKIPALLLNWSVGAFLVGLGVYLGSLWIRDLDSQRPQGSSLGILITYIIVTAAGLLLFFVPMLLKNLEGAPIRRLEEQIERENPKDKPSRTPPERPRMGRNLELDEGYRVPPNEPRANLPQESATFDTGTQEHAEDANAQIQEATEELGQSIESNKIPPDRELNNNLDGKTVFTPTQTDSLTAALEASILAQERSIASFRALLYEHQKLLGIRRTTSTE